MIKLLTTMALGALIAGPALVQSANAQRLDPARERVIRDWRCKIVIRMMNTKGKRAAASSGLTAPA